MIESFNFSILEVDKSTLAKGVLGRLKPTQWPLSINDLPNESVLVGGAVRDALLGVLKPNLDLDLVVPMHAVQLTQALADKHDATCVILDMQRDIARLVKEDWTIDIASRYGTSIEEDLLRRDYTINSIGITLDSTPNLIDPTGGLKDLKNKKLVAVSENNLIQDPLRLLRGFRLMAEFDLVISTETLYWIQLHSKMLYKVASERIQEEIKRIIVASCSGKVIPLIQSSCLLDPWSNKENFFHGEPPNFRNLSFYSSNELSIAIPLTRLVYLLDDLGIEELRFSKQTIRKCKLLRKWLKRCKDNGYLKLKEDEQLSLHKDLEQFLPAFICSLPMKDQFFWLKRWRNNSDTLFHPSSPIDGISLQNILGIQSGPGLGKLMNYLCHENAFGRLQNSDEVLQAARNWIQHNQTFL